MVWYRKIFGAMNIARGGGSFSSEHLDPDEWLVQNCPIGRWQSASITNAKCKKIQAYYGPISRWLGFNCN
jgi:hypothetical protein